MLFDNSIHCCVIKDILCSVLNDKNVTSTEMKNLGTKKEVKITKLRVRWLDVRILIYKVLTKTFWHKIHKEIKNLDL